MQLQTRRLLAWRSTYIRFHLLNYTAACFCSKILWNQDNQCVRRTDLLFPQTPGPGTELIELTGPETLEMVLEDYWKVRQNSLNPWEHMYGVTLSFQVSKPMELFYEFEVRDVNHWRVSPDLHPETFVQLFMVNLDCPLPMIFLLSGLCHCQKMPCAYCRAKHCKLIKDNVSSTVNECFSPHTEQLL